MQFKKTTTPFPQSGTDVAIVLCFESAPPAEALSDFSTEQANIDQVAASAQQLGFTGKAGSSLLIPTFGKLRCHHVLFVGIGKEAAFDSHAQRKACAQAAKKLAAMQSVATAFVAPKYGERLPFVQAAVEGLLLGTHTFNKYKKIEHAGRLANSELSIFCAVDAKQFNVAKNQANAIAGATIWAREMIAEPACYMTPTRIAEHALSLSGDKVSCEVLDHDQAEKLGMGAFLAVTAGSDQPPKFIVLRYTNAQAQKTIGLAGKGITFDSGGLSIKTAQGMENMKYDMSGAAAVLATMKVIAQLQPKINVIAVAAACENMPSGKATHPGDVVKAMNGKTIEINNTDAEGRLILADALNYLCKQTPKPEEIVDIATLTGGAVTALGRVAAAIMGNDQQLIDGIINAGAEAGEKLWQLPLYDEYKEALQSDIADMKNSGARGEAIPSAAGMFLKEFIDGVKWAHMDIAGPAWMDKERDELTKGGTAFGVRTLSYYILGAAK